ncbi:MAG TPA: thioredoxin domain-containing protein [Spirochaetota bacterium]|nr:thioredoxin domain-containing protein [Spirochaetota bacterium]
MKRTEIVKNIFRKAVAAALLAGALAVFGVGAVHAGSQKPRLGKHVLAVVNGSEISVEYFNERLEEAPEMYRDDYENDKVGFLDRLILEMLLVAEAEKLGFDSEVQDTADYEEARSVMINKLLSHIADSASITESELSQFYSENRDRMGESPFEQVKEQIRDYLLMQKRQQTIGQYLQQLQQKADIIKNERWTAKQASSGPEGLLQKALKSGMPSVIDFGSDTCTPCKMMKPILEELKGVYKGKALVLVIDIYKNRGIATEYGIRVIPTQIFFDEKGVEFWRHEGFLSKEEIVKKLEGIGIE